MPMLAFLLLSLVGGPTDYTLFESGQVRPLAVSAGGDVLYALNTPDGRLELLDITAAGLRPRNAVPVGMEPVALAVAPNGDVWVVNHLSDSISIVDVTDPDRAFVRRTLLVGDEPRDIVFAGPGAGRAFITCAHRGQNAPFDPQLDTPGIGRADVWVFDAQAPGAGAGGDPLTLVTLFGDTPRALAVSPDGNRVYAAVFLSGNRTTTLSEGVVPNGGPGNGGLPAPRANVDGVPAPETGLIVGHDGTKWTDELDRDWSPLVRFDLPDYDVFTIDAAANPPVETGTPFSSVGTVLFNMAVNPVSGKLYVSHTEAGNRVRFEGPGILAGSSLRGNLHDSRIAVLEDGAAPALRRLNKHIDYNQCCDPVPNTVNDRSLALPQQMAVTPDGTTLFVAALGSDKVGIFDTAELEADTFVPDADAHVALSGGGPTGLIWHNGRLYALTRFDNGISVIDPATRTEIDHVTLFSPEEASVTTGRRFLYDAAYTSSHGDQACASCHVYGDLDALAWDLGNPDESVLNNPNPFTVGPIINPDFHPIKGPMTTQSLRGMANHGAMHWRGDRTGGNDGPTSQPDDGAFDERAAFGKFNPAFEGLIGRSEPLTEEEMAAFTDFVLQLTYPPNPIRALDNGLTAAQQRGHDFFFGPVSDTAEACNGCHVIDRGANPGAAAPGFFGSNGGSSFENEPQIMKVAHLRNLYTKVGMFGMAATSFLNSGNNGHMGPQIRGFGFMHDGSCDTIFRFMNAVVFNESVINPDGFPRDAVGDGMRRDMEAFMTAVDTNLYPVVGQEITLRADAPADADARIDLLRGQADLGRCDLVAHGLIAGEVRGYRYQGGGSWQGDRATEAPLSDAALRAAARAAGAALTYTAWPPGSGTRVALDRDRDGVYNRDERDACSDPGDPESLPLGFAEVLPLWAVQPLCGTRSVTVADLISRITPTRRVTSVRGGATSIARR